MRGQWSGDEDLGDGSVQRLYKVYSSRCGLVRNMQVEHIPKIKSDLESDIRFLEESSAAAKVAYESALDVCGKREQMLMELAWNVTRYEELLKQAKAYQGERSETMSYIQLGGLENVKKLLVPFKLKFEKYLKRLFSKKRSAATHLLIFMTSNELRTRSLIKYLYNSCHTSPSLIVN